MFIQISFYKGKWMSVHVKCSLLPSQMDCTTAEIFQKEKCPWPVTREARGDRYRGLVGRAGWLHHWGWHQGTVVWTASLNLGEYWESLKAGACFHVTYTKIVLQIFNNSLTRILEIRTNANWVKIDLSGLKYEI